MKIQLKSFPIDNVKLEVFESLVYSRRHNEAGIELLKIVKSLKMGAGFAGYETSEDAIGRLYTRLANAITTLLADPGAELSQAGFDLLAVEHGTLHSIFRASAFGNADYLLRLFGTRRPEDPLRLEFSGTQNLVKLLISYSLDSIYELDFEKFFAAEPKLALPVFLGMLAHTIVISPEAHRRREKLLTLGGLFEGVELQDHMLTAVRDAYMHCSYATGAGKHDVKRVLNRMLSRLVSSRFDPPALVGRRLQIERPTILVQLEWFHSAHAMYRCYAPSIRRLRDRFRLVAIGNERSIDDRSKQLFDETIEMQGESESALGIVEHIKRIAPDVIYYPSIGMSARCVTLSSSRLAPIQVATMGHPATTQSEAIDYVIVPECGPGEPSGYSETVLLGEGMPPMAIPAGEEFPVISADPSPAVLQIAVPAMASKLNAPFMALCQRIAGRARRPVQFHFLPAKVGILWSELRQQIKYWIPDAVVHPRLDYNEYLEVLSHFHLHLSPFPFGGTNSNIDSMRLRIPMVALKGLEAHGQSDAAMMRHAGLPEMLIARTPDEYEEVALRLISDDAMRALIASQLRETDIADLFLDGSDRKFAEDFVRLFSWIYQKHEEIQASGIRYWSVSERRSRYPAFAS